MTQDRSQNRSDLPRQYSAPSLTVYGSVAKLTAAQAGSVAESIAGNSGSKTKPG